ncbi:MAG: SDR family NAD(P)-dependent oxidoreductase [Planctomycetota bacterium]
MQNRVIVITGASSGIGAATARALAGVGRLALVGRDRERLQAVVDQVKDAGGEAQAIIADLSEVDAAAAVVAETVERYGEIDAVINNAGAFITAPADAVDAAHIAALLPINLRAPMLLTVAAIPHLRAQGGGMVINVSSVAATAGFPTCGVYAAAKAGVEAWSQVLREELRADHIRVGVVVPGATDTPIFAGMDFDRSKMARAEDVARAIVFMLDSPVTASIDRVVVTPPGGTL